MKLRVEGPFSEWLRRWRESHGYSLRDLSNSSGIPTSQLHTLETVRLCNPKLEKFVGLSRATGEPIEALVKLAVIQRASALRKTKITKP